MATFFGAAESVSKFAPDRFRANVMNNFGMASQSRWEVMLPSIDGMNKVSGGKVGDPSNSDDRNLFCVAANVPGKQLQTTPRGFTIENKQVVNGHTLTPVSMTFYLTNSYVMRDYFERWMQCITHHGEKNKMNSPNLVAYRDNYVQDIKMVQYTRAARKAFTIKLIDAFPTAISAIEWNSQLQTQAMELTVEFTYRMYWTDPNKKSGSL